MPATTTGKPYLALSHQRLNLSFYRLSASPLHVQLPTRYQLGMTATLFGILFSHNDPDVFNMGSDKPFWQEGPFCDPILCDFGGEKRWWLQQQKWKNCRVDIMNVIDSVKTFDWTTYDSNGPHALRGIIKSRIHDIDSRFVPAKAINISMVWFKRDVPWAFQCKGALYRECIRLSAYQIHSAYVIIRNRVDVLKNNLRRTWKPALPETWNVTRR